MNDVCVNGVGYTVTTRGVYDYYIRNDVSAHVDFEKDEDIILQVMSDYIFETVEKYDGMVTEKYLVKVPSDNKDK